MAAEGGFAENRSGSVEKIGRTVKRNVWSAIAYLIFAPFMGSGCFSAVIVVSACSDSRRSDAPRLSFLLNVMNSDANKERKV